MSLRMNGVIQAGGRANRMGTNKAFLEIGGKTIIERIVGELRQCADEIVLIANDPSPYRHLGLKIFPDEVPGRGSFGGIYTALVRSGGEYNFITACDMPFVDAAFVRRLASLAEGYDIVVARTERGFEPLAALYSRAALPAAKRMIEEGDSTIRNLFEKVRTRVVEIDAAEMERHPRLFFNINTPDDLNAARRLLESQ